ncbi:amino acid ABC transporter substrate-binding protein (PAAT family) [Branchiibius hedensis]|uniref:Amino acid ABC transporter substrate-binding protein, PAAT family n=1 Tax=Branchiibius hedensis TaxID=672460 RepID=A0A2Y8ZU67_9MICO|nr:transporter substrate-binding domain-containing protein [Branchiibius hedensis]PWJ26634.1 amino acid ABC transporter substrate-binding protein (PAAT family) [Branchiibius hedensis]SSA35445.1 amino acid ABC transporter substrate-binding protein, PAAT family [Branchiibius hedensis]
MSTRPLVPALAVLGIALAGCSSSGQAATSSDQPTADLVSAVKVDNAARTLLPQTVQKSDVITLGTTQAVGTAGLPHAGVDSSGQEIGLSIDLRNAVAKKLGITFKEEFGTFASIIPGVQNGKYQAGQANFGVTKARSQVVDFATYLNDGQAFLGRKDLKIDKVSQITDLCGLKLATSPGTTFQKQLESHAGDCAKAGKPNWTVQYFADTAPIYLGLQNGKVDVFFGPAVTLKYQATKIPNTKYLGTFSTTPVGFATAKGSPIAPALVSAVNSLIKDGTYGKILAKWKVPDNAITTSQLNPPAPF